MICGCFMCYDLIVLFFVDPDLGKDPNMADVSVITLSYTFYPANSAQLKNAQDKFYKSQE